MSAIYIWEEVKIKILNIIEKLQYEFSIRFFNFYYIDLKIKLLQIHFIVYINDVERRLQIEIIVLQSDNSFKAIFFDVLNLVQFNSSLYQTKFSKLQYIYKC